MTLYSTIDRLEAITKIAYDFREFTHWVNRYGLQEVPLACNAPYKPSHYGL